MDKEAWALVGVVVGGILGGGAQVLAGFLERRHQVAHWERAHQRDVYVRWVQYLHALFAHLELAQRRAASHSLGLAVTPQTTDLVASSEGPRALAELRLVAPDDTYAAALRSRGAVIAVFRGMRASGGQQGKQNEETASESDAEHVVGEQKGPGQAQGQRADLPPSDDRQESFQELSARFRERRDEFIVLARRDLGTLRGGLPPVKTSGSAGPDDGSEGL